VRPQRRQLALAGVGGQALHHGGDPGVIRVGERVHRHQPDLPHLVREGRRPDDEHERAGGTRSASTRAAACALVTTSSGSAGMPRPVRRSATADGGREALLVT
jgi:hypothetical protein